MLTALLFCVLLPLQDAPAGADPAVPAEPPAKAAQDKPAAAPAPVPTETPEAVLKFLKDAEARLYDPQAEGLTSLEFDVPIEHPTYGTLGTTHVSWGTDHAVAMTTTAADAKIPITAEELDPVGQQVAQQLLGGMLNKPITPMLEGAVATMDGVQDGLVKVRFHNAAAEAQGMREQSLFFDDTGLLQKLMVEGDVEGPVGKMKVRQTHTFTWRVAKDGSELLVTSMQKTIADTSMGKATGETSFTYETIAQIVLPVSVAMKQSAPLMGESSQTLRATNLKVNGQTAGG